MSHNATSRHDPAESQAALERAEGRADEARLAVLEELDEVLEAELERDDAETRAPGR